MNRPTTYYDSELSLVSVSAIGAGGALFAVDAHGNLWHWTHSSLWHRVIGPTVGDLEPERAAAHRRAVQAELDKERPTRPEGK